MVLIIATPPPEEAIGGNRRRGNRRLRYGGLSRIIGPSIPVWISTEHRWRLFGAFRGNWSGTATSISIGCICSGHLGASAEPLPSRARTVRFSCRCVRISRRFARDEKLSPRRRGDALRDGRERPPRSSSSSCERRAGCGSRVRSRREDSRSPARPTSFAWSAPRPARSTR